MRTLLFKSFFLLSRACKLEPHCMNCLTARGVVLDNIITKRMQFYLFSQRRRRTSRPSTPGGTDQPSPQTSPARRGPKRNAPAPPRRPPLIPTFDEWKSDRGATGDNERPTAGPSAENSPSKPISSDKGDETPKTTAPTSDGSGSRSPKVSTGDGTNQADIKLLARQLLMDARKKAGASGALPRERVAEIAKTSRGPTADKTTTGSVISDGPAQVKEKVKAYVFFLKEDAVLEIQAS